MSSKEKNTVEAEAEERIRESEYLKKLSYLANYNSDLAIAKAQSAELVRQMDNYRAHYEQFENLTRKLIVEYDNKIGAHLKEVLKLAESLDRSSKSLHEQIDEEVGRLTEEMVETIEGTIMEACTEELARVQEAVEILTDYAEKVKKRSKRFDKIEKFKFVLFIISSLASPAVLILMLLSYFKVI